VNAIVLTALKRPYTFVVLAIMIIIFGGRAVLRTPIDIFPNIGIPVVAVVWTGARHDEYPCIQGPCRDTLVSAIFGINSV
jgi:multidrug efflux pump subunit AcrB